MKKRFGFTMIEVALFLALTGVIFVGMAIGMNNSIAQQRANDSVQNFADFLRNVYSEVENVQGVGDGRSDYAIYGKLITFGEDYNLSFESNDDATIFVYDVVGSANGSMGSGALDALRSLVANVVVKTDETWSAAGLVEAYHLNWSAKLEKINSHDDFIGAVLIVRSPSSGTIYTYTMTGETIQVNETLKTAQAYPEMSYNPLSNYLNSTHFAMNQIDFCVNPDNSSFRRNIRISANSHNSSGISIATDEENQCGSL